MENVRTEFQKAKPTRRPHLEQKPESAFYDDNFSKLQTVVISCSIVKIGHIIYFGKILKSSFQCCKPCINKIFLSKVMTKRVNMYKISPQNFCIINTLLLFCSFSLYNIFTRAKISLVNSVIIKSIRIMLKTIKTTQNQQE